MTIQYSSDTKKGYEDFLKQYDADKSGVSDWTEYLTGLQQSVKDTSTAYQKSAYNDISQAYRNYFIQSSNLAGKGLASGLQQSLSNELMSKYQNTKSGIQENAANKIAGLFEDYGKTVSEAEKTISERAGNLTKVTEAALDWYEQVGSSKKILDDKMQETDDYRYQDLIDLYKENEGELWQKSSDDVSSPYVLSGLGQAIVDTAFADEDFANYLKDYDSKLDLRDVFLDNKDALYEALNVGKQPNKISDLISNTESAKNVPWDLTKLEYDADDATAAKAIKDIEYIPDNDSVTTYSVLYNPETFIDVKDPKSIYNTHLKYLKPTGTTTVKINDDYYRYNASSKKWFKARLATDEEKRSKKSSANPVAPSH